MNPVVHLRTGAIASRACRSSLLQLKQFNSHVCSRGLVPSKLGQLFVCTRRSRKLNARVSAQLDHSLASPQQNYNGSIPPASAAGEQQQNQDDNTVVDQKRQIEERFERAIFNCRFFTLFAVVGSLAGSLLCFFKGSTYIAKSFMEYFQNCCQGIGSGKVILLLVEAVDVYLVGTVMLIFGMGLYELFVATLDVPGGVCYQGVSTTVCGSNFFGLFRLRERPKWLEIRSLDELKTKLGHVIVMVLLVGMFEKSKKIPVNSSLELLCFSTSILLSSCCLFLLSKLHTSNHT